MPDSNKKKLFSVVIPTYNHARYIKRCLDSLISQTYSNWEAIIINNFSEDNTIELVDEYNDNRIKIINFKNNGIIGASRNIGIKNSNGDWICFLDSDDWWYPNKLEECSKYLEINDIVYHDMHIFTISGKQKIHYSQSRHLSENPCIDLVMNGNAICNSTVVVRKSILEKAGNISEDTNLIGVEDYDCWIRIATITTKFYYVPKILSGYWISPTNISYSRNPIENTKYLFYKHLRLLPDNLKSEANKRFAYRIGDLWLTFSKIDKALMYYRISIKSNKLAIAINSFKRLIYLRVRFLI